MNVLNYEIKSKLHKSSSGRLWQTAAPNMVKNETKIGCVLVVAYGKEIFEHFLLKY